MSQVITPNTIKKSRTSFLLVVAAFLCPVIIAKLALQQHWFNEAVTNNGQLISLPLTLNELGVAVNDKKWLLLYVVPEACNESCQQMLTVIEHTYIALGQDMPRVLPTALVTQSLDNTWYNQAHWQVLPVSEKAQQLAQNHLYIVDPLGNIILQHRISNGLVVEPSASTSHEKAFANFGKAVLADMKKLLKYSRIG